MWKFYLLCMSLEHQMQQKNPKKTKTQISLNSRDLGIPNPSNLKPFKFRTKFETHPKSHQQNIQMTKRKRTKKLITLRLLQAKHNTTISHNGAFQKNLGRLSGASIFGSGGGFKLTYLVRGGLDERSTQALGDFLLVLERFF